MLIFSESSECETLIPRPIPQRNGACPGRWRKFSALPACSSPSMSLTCHFASLQLAIVIVGLSANFARADSVNNAFAVCAWFDSTGLPSEPCYVSGWNSSVEATLDMNGSEARKMCAQTIGILREQGVTFDDGWKLRISSPFSGASTIAQCNLPG